MSGSLADELRAAVRGDVRFDPGTRALYATDASNYRQVPMGVVLPRDASDVEAVLAVCRSHGAPVLARGGGTSLAGQCCNVAVLMDFSRYMNALIDVDTERRLARVQPGIVLDDLRRPLERDYGLTFAPDPSTHNRCTIGGMLGNNACGVHSIYSEFHGPGPRSADNVEALEVVTYDGLRMHVGATAEDELAAIAAGSDRRAQIYRDLRDLRHRYAELIRARFPKIPRRVSGYSLDALLPENGCNVAQALVGTEGTCITILNATLRLMPMPPARSLVALGFEDVFAAAAAVPRIREFRPFGLEGMDDVLIDDVRQKGLHADGLTALPQGNGWLLVEFGAESQQAADAAAQAMMHSLSATAGAPAMKLVSDPAEARRLWIVRESGLGASAFVAGKPDTWEGWEDSAVPPEALADYLRGFRALLAEYDYRGPLYGHFGQGCVHTRINFDLTSADGISKYRAFVEDAAELVVQHGGSLSGEHGDGQSRAELLPVMFGEELVEAFRRFKTIWDPDNRMNPGKVVNACRLDENLRLGPEYRPWTPDTHFQFPNDQGSIARAALRCVGVGECRKHDHGTMCPSYMATGEEMHSTRGRAHLLFEMLRGETLESRWREPHVREALDLCLACKACRHECPVQVDMATYKAEFYAHYYRRRLRPRAAYSMGLIHRWARLAAHAPRLVNTLTHAPVLRDLARAFAGIAPERTIPRFANETFRARWFRQGGPGTDDAAATVILWVDSFNNYFYPHVLHAAARALQACGHTVAVARPVLCCGRPLYDFGFLTTAKKLLLQVLDELRPALERQLPIVVLEPSCAAVFHDELLNLFPDRDDARQLAQLVQPFAKFLDTEALPPAVPKLGRKALLHAHCHQKAWFGVTSDSRVLERVGVEFDVLDAGCCGMAGSFGFEREKYDISVRIGERVLLPAVRAADPATIIVADGFSCREQIAQLTSRRALHLAEVVAGAIGRAEES